MLHIRESSAYVGRSLTKIFLLMLLPDRRHIISSFRVISTNGDCPRVRSAKFRSGNLYNKSSATQDSLSGNAFSNPFSVALVESTPRQVVLAMHE